MKLLATTFFIFLAAAAIAQNVGVGTPSPQAQLSVGPNSQFRVDNSGNITRINDVPYHYPNAQGASGKTLVNDGAGNLGWKEAGVPIGSIVMCQVFDTANLIARGFAITGYSQLFQQSRSAATGTWTPFSNTINTTGGFYMQDNPSVYSGTEMLTYYNNLVYRWNPAGTVWTQSSANTVPAFTAPQGSTAVWTGTEMIIFNGNKGVKYNPSTNSWTAISDAPFTKTYPSAVWTGTEMIVWGGYSSGVTQTGHKYNPTTNTWSAPISTTGAPAARYRHAAVWTGSKMIITQGEDNAGNTLGTTYAYNPGSNTWDAPLASAGISFSEAKAVWTGSVMLVTGSAYLPNLGNYYTLTYAYNAGANSWSQFANEGRAGNNDWRSNIVYTGTEMLMIRGQGAQKFTYSGTSMTLSLPFVIGYYMMRKLNNL